MYEWVLRRWIQEKSVRWAKMMKTIFITFESEEILLHKHLILVFIFFERQLHLHDFYKFFSFCRFHVSFNIVCWEIECTFLYVIRMSFLDYMTACRKKERFENSQRLFSMQMQVHLKIENQMKIKRISKMKNAYCGLLCCTTNTTIQKLCTLHFVINRWFWDFPIKWRLSKVLVRKITREKNNHEFIWTKRCFTFPTQIIFRLW